MIAQIRQQDTKEIRVNFIVSIGSNSFTTNQMKIRNGIELFTFHIQKQLITRMVIRHFLFHLLHLNQNRTFVRTELMSMYILYILYYIAYIL